MAAYIPRGSRGILLALRVVRLYWYYVMSRNSTDKRIKSEPAVVGYYAAISGNFLPTFRDIYRSHAQG